MSSRGSAISSASTIGHWRLLHSALLGVWVLSFVYSCAELFLNPTKDENYLIVSLETEARGTVVVSRDMGGRIEALQGCSSYGVSLVKEARVLTGNTAANSPGNDSVLVKRLNAPFLFLNGGN